MLHLFRISIKYLSDGEVTRDSSKKECDTFLHAYFKNISDGTIDCFLYEDKLGESRLNKNDWIIFAYDQVAYYTGIVKQAAKLDIVRHSEKSHARHTNYVKLDQLYPVSKRSKYRQIKDWEIKDVPPLGWPTFEINKQIENIWKSLHKSKS